MWDQMIQAEIDYRREHLTRGRPVKRRRTKRSMPFLPGGTREERTGRAR